MVTKTTYDIEELGEVVHCEMRKAMIRLQQNGVPRMDAAMLAAAMALGPPVGYLRAAFGSESKPTNEDCETLICQIFELVKQWVAADVLTESKGDE